VDGQGVGWRARSSCGHDDEGHRSWRSWTWWRRSPRSARCASRRRAEGRGVNHRGHGSSAAAPISIMGSSVGSRSPVARSPSTMAAPGVCPFCPLHLLPFGHRDPSSRQAPWADPDRRRRPPHRGGQCRGRQQVVDRSPARTGRQWSSALKVDHDARAGWRYCPTRPSVRILGCGEDVCVPAPLRLRQAAG
jgi:hypothetical protein